MWALDLGTTNTNLARWDRSAERPRLLELPAICRRPGQEDHLEAPRTVPSATHVIEEPGWWGRLGRWRPLARHFFMGKLAHIGRAALELNEVRVHRSFAEAFKQALGRGSLGTLASAGGRTYSARGIAQFFLRELLAEVKSVTGERIRRLVITSPVEAFELYRAELVVNAERWLCATVFDLRTRKHLMREEPVVRLL